MGYVLARRRGRHLWVTGRGREVVNCGWVSSMSDEAGLQRALLDEDILRTARQAAAVNFLLARLAAAFLGAAFMPTLRPRPSDFAKSDRCAA